MSTILALATPSVALAVSERRWTRFPEDTVYEGAPKMAALENGFAVAGGDANSMTALLASLQTVPDVKADDVARRIEAVRTLFSATFGAAVILRRPEGLQLMAGTDTGVATLPFRVYPFGFFAAPPPWDPNAGDLHALATEAANECGRLKSARAIVARAARLFAEIAERSRYSGRILDVGLLTPEHSFYLSGDALDLANERRQDTLNVRPPRFHAVLRDVHATDSVLAPVGIVGEGVNEVWVYRKRVPEGSATDPDSVEAPENLVQVLTPDENRAVTIAMDVPPERYQDEIRFRPFGVNEAGRYTPGYARDVTLWPPSAQAPHFEQTLLNTGTKVISRLSATLRGIAITSMQVRSSAGRQPLGALRDPDRDSGDTSAIEGDVLGALEWEAEVSTQKYSGADILWFYTLANGESGTVPTPHADPNFTPGLATQPRVEGSKVYVDGDDDTASQYLERDDGLWRVSIDNWSGEYDVSAADDDGTPGQANDTTRYYTPHLFSGPLSDPGLEFIGSPVAVTIGTPATEPTIDVLTLTSPEIGEHVLGIRIECSDDPVGYTAELALRYERGGRAWDPSTPQVVTTDPALSTPPTAATDYTYEMLSTYRREIQVASSELLTVEATVRIRNGSDDVVRTKTKTAQWYVRGEGTEIQ